MSLDTLSMASVEMSTSSRLLLSDNTRCSDVMLRSEKNPITALRSVCKFTNVSHLGDSVTSTLTKQSDDTSELASRRNKFLQCISSAAMYATIKKIRTHTCVYCLKYIHKKSYIFFFFFLFYVSVDAQIERHVVTQHLVVSSNN